MATFRHPVTGVELNNIKVIRRGRVSEKERHTAALLLAEGHPRWLVAAMLGCFPLTFDGTGSKPERRRSARGGHLSVRDARADPRQSDMSALFDDLFGT